MGARQFPIRLARPEKLVYTPHEYGPGVHKQAWFDDLAFPRNLEDVWRKHRGYLLLEERMPVLVLASPHWSAADMEHWLLGEADHLVEREEDVALVALDQSLLEKPESQVALGLCPVR